MFETFELDSNDMSTVLVQSQQLTSSTWAVVIERTTHSESTLDYPDHSINEVYRMNRDHRCRLRQLGSSGAPIEGQC
jgi:hypothetical protein